MAYDKWNLDELPILKHSNIKLNTSYKIKIIYLTY